MAGGATGWVEISVRLPPAADAGRLAAATDALASALFELGTPGLEERDGHLVAYFPYDAALAGRLAALRRAVRRLLGPGAGVTSRRLAPVDWAEAWKREVRATAVAPGIVVAPTWDSYDARPGEIVLRLDPGLAFGTGTHPSTRLCLAALAALRPVGRVLDLGTGSGILAIAAAKLGAREVLALDTDPVAVGVARANVARNDVAGAVRVEPGSLEAASGRFDCALANLAAAPLLAMAGELAERLSPGGVAVLSGLLAEEVAGV
ncbi:MAG TPA: 50S ribosomal protein L11 methyltransferase, partial [Thermodesulfobacteriota bacterium]|nr:50S ribosomal protein L11 methyltransferase [Thermodesulfobacteriota bacterium]